MKNINKVILLNLLLISLANAEDQKESAYQLNQQNTQLPYNDQSLTGSGIGGGMFGMGLGTGAGISSASAPSGSTVSVKFKGSENNSQCKYEKTLEVYYCNQNGTKILIKNLGFSTTAIKFDEKQKKITSLAIEEIKDGEKILYKEAVFPSGNYGGYPGIGSSFTNEQLNQRLKEQKQSTNYNNLNFQLPPNISNPTFEASSEISFLKMGIDPLLGNNLPMMGSFNTKNITGDQEFEKQFSNLREYLKARKNQLSEAFEESQVTLELEDGKQLKCDRKTSLRDLNQEEEKIFSNSQNTYNAKIQCGMGSCEDVVIDGKKYTPLLSFDSNPMMGSRGEITLLSKDNDRQDFGPALSIKTIKTQKENVTLIDNSYYLKNKNTNGAYFNNYQNELLSTLPKELHAKKDKILSLKDPNLEMYMRFNHEYCREPRELLKRYDAAKKNFLTDLANAEVAEYISIVQNGRLIGSFVSKEYAQKEGCIYQGVFVDLKSIEHLEKIKKNIHPDNNAQTISLKKANELFLKAQGMDDIAWKYKPDGCYARAHLMARRFEEEGVRVDKVWIKGDLSIPEAGINWNFHVAPIVYVEENGQIKKMVIDPSLFEKPVTVEEWDAKMQKNTVRGSAVTAFPFPENSAFYERSTLSFSTSDPYLPLDSVYMSEDEKMNLANRTMKQYKTMEPKQ